MKTNPFSLPKNPAPQPRPVAPRPGGMRAFAAATLLLGGLAFNAGAASFDSRVVGGQPADIASFPYQVALIGRPYNPANIDPNQFCGGSIVDREWILTAAHCSAGVAPGSVAVAVGVTDLTRPQTGRIFHVDRIVVHPNYNASTYENDVALWHLAEPIDFAGAYTAQPIALVTPAEAAAGVTAPGRTAMISGWGTVASGGASPSRLQAAAVPITAQSTYPAGAITADMIMAGYSAGGVDTCQGDSGGPLAVRNAAGALVLAGVTSWGFGCAEQGHPGVYARVSHQHAWLTSQLPDRSVYVDWRFTGANPDGSVARPFRSVERGYLSAAASSRLKIRQGNYLARFALTKPMLLEPYDGAVLLGGSGSGFVPNGTIDGNPQPTLGRPMTRPDGTFSMSFTGMAGLRYQVFATEDLVNWRLWRDFVAAADTFEIVDPDARVTPHRFFRVTVP